MLKKFSNFYYNFFQRRNEHSLQVNTDSGEINFEIKIHKILLFHRTITATEKCIKDYSSKCLDAFPRQVTSVLAFGVAKTNKGYCTNQRRKDKFISIGKCGNQIKLEGDKCMQTYIDRLKGVETLTKSDNNLKVPLMCWSVLTTIRKILIFF